LRCSRRRASGPRTKRNVLIYIEPGDPTRFGCDLRERSITMVNTEEPNESNPERCR
jgi:hypothetical protein